MPPIKIGDPSFLINLLCIEVVLSSQRILNFLKKIDNLKKLIKQKIIENSF